jgi:hypothetical protein
MKKNFILLKIDSADNYIITELVEETELQLVVKYPVVIRVASSMESISVHTTKFMPFSMNNVVAFSKSSILALSKPNERIIEYYLNFLSKYSEVLDDAIESQILDMNDGYEEELYDEHAKEEDTITDDTEYSSNTIIH